MNTHCVMELYGEEACSGVSETFPICDLHLARLSEEFQFIPADHVRENHLEKGDEAFVFNRKNGEVYSLNSTGAFILKGLLEGKVFRVQLEELWKTFSMNSLREAINGYKEFTDELARLGLGEMKNGKRA